MHLISRVFVPVLVSASFSGCFIKKLFSRSERNVVKTDDLNSTEVNSTLATGDPVSLPEVAVTPQLLSALNVPETVAVPVLTGAPAPVTADTAMESADAVKSPVEPTSESAPSEASPVTVSESPSEEKPISVHQGP